MKRIAILPAFILVAALFSSCKKDDSNTETLNWAYSTAFGTGGNSNGQFQLLTGMEVDASGNVYTSDINLNRVQKFNPSGTFITEWGNFGTGNGEFNWPRDIVENSDGNMEVLDQDNFRIQEFTSAGVYVSQFGTSGSANGQFGESYDMARDKNDILYVADFGNARIQKFSAARTHLLSWDYGSLYGNPNDIACDAAGDVFVAFDYQAALPRTQTIAHYSPTGTLIDTWNVSLEDTLAYVAAFDFDSQDNLHVGGSDGIIRIYKKDGTFIKKWGVPGGGPGEILALDELQFGPNDDLYIGGCKTNANCRISKFTKVN